MNKKFLFITHLSPVAIRSSLRQGMIESMQKSLYHQSYTNWKALWIGEQELQNDKIKEVALKDKSELGTIYLRKDIIDYMSDCDYIVKLDDDDIILPNTLDIASKLDFDCYCDSYHTFYDISSGTLTQQNRNWIASTCIHKKEYAIINQNMQGVAENFIDSLFYGEHGKDWISFYKNKKIIYADKNNPVYVRILSPTSITAGAKTFPVKSISDVSLPHYYTYLKQFGVWNTIKLKQFEYFKKDLEKNWKHFSDLNQLPIPGITLFEKVKSKIKSYLK